MRFTLIFIDVDFGRVYFRADAIFGDFHHACNSPDDFTDDMFSIHAPPPREWFPHFHRAGMQRLRARPIM